MNLRPIKKEDNAAIAEIIRKNLEKACLALPGTAYYDPELGDLYGFFQRKPEERAYIVLEDDDGTIIGGVGFAKFEGFECCAELTKLYLADKAKGKGFGKMMVLEIEKTAKSFGYKNMYLETHTNLSAAIKLYEKLGYVQMDRPDFSVHNAMNRFYIKTL